MQIKTSIRFRVACIVFTQDVRAYQLSTRVLKRRAHPPGVAPVTLEVSLYRQGELSRWWSQQLFNGRADCYLEGFIFTNVESFSGKV